MVTLYHNKEFTKYKNKKDIKASNLFIVAEVEEIGDDIITKLENVFKITQNVEYTWTTNFNINGIKRPDKFTSLGVAVYQKARSTSVGDVMELDGKFFVVTNCWIIEIDSPFK